MILCKFFNGFKLEVFGERHKKLLTLLDVVVEC